MINDGWQSLGAGFAIAQAAIFLWDARLEMIEFRFRLMKAKSIFIGILKDIDLKIQLGLDFSPRDAHVC